jgi:hypothetical protein
MVLQLHGNEILIHCLMCVFSSDGIVVEFVITSSEVMDKRALEDMPWEALRPIYAKDWDNVQSALQTWKLGQVLHVLFWNGDGFFFLWVAASSFRSLFQNVVFFFFFPCPPKYEEDHNRANRHLLQKQSNYVLSLSSVCVENGGATSSTASLHRVWRNSRDRADLASRSQDSHIPTWHHHRSARQGMDPTFTLVDHIHL